MDRALGALMGGEICLDGGPGWQLGRDIGVGLAGRQRLSDCTVVDCLPGVLGAPGSSAPGTLAHYFSERGASAEEARVEKFQMCTGVRCTGVVTNVNDRNILSLLEGEVREKLEEVAINCCSWVLANNSTVIWGIQSIIEIFILGRCHNSRC